MSEIDHWMRFNIGDYLADTMHLSTFQHGIYLLLIMHCFKHGELPGDEASLMQIARISQPLIWRQTSLQPMALFTRSAEGKFCHPRVTAELERSRAISEARRNAGKQGAKAKWGMANATANATGGNGQEMANATYVRRRARATPEPELDPYPPVGPPPAGDRRARPSRNAMVDIIREDMETERERNNPQVVPIPRHPNRRRNDS